MAELAGLIGRREARISRGQFQIISVGRDFPGSETSKPNRCLISSEACMAVAPMLQRFHPNFGIQRERKGGEDAKHPPFRPDLLHAKGTIWDKTVHRAITPALREDSNLVRRSLVPSASWIRLGAVGSFEKSKGFLPAAPVW